MRAREDGSSAWRASAAIMRHLAMIPTDRSTSRSFFGSLARYVSYYGHEPKHLPEASLDQLFPGVSTRTICLRHTVEAKSLPFGEAFALAAIADVLKPQRVFEIGTFTGGATLLLAEHGAPQVRVFTLDLPPDQKGLRLPGLGEDPPEADSSRIGERFRGKPSAARITQLYGDSASFDFSPYAGVMDLILVDGSHSYAYVKADSENALRMLSPGGAIIWDDCSFVYPGLVRALDELGARTPIYRIASTRFAVHLGRPSS